MRNAVLHVRSSGTYRRPVRCATSVQHRTSWTSAPASTKILPESEIRSEEHRSYRIRQHGNKELPLPPLLDPVVDRARARLVNKRQDFDVAQVTPLQMEVLLNPFARALASPIRQCRLTHARLPVHCLQRIGVDRDTDAKTGEFRMRLYDECKADDRQSAIASTVYLSNVRDVAEQLETDKACRMLPDMRMMTRAAALTNKSATAYNLREKFCLHDDFLPDIEDSLESAVLSLLSEVDTETWWTFDDQAADAGRIAAFIRRTSEDPRIVSLQEKPCYYLPSHLFPDSTEGDSTIAITASNSAVHLILALERLFMYKQWQNSITDGRETADEDGANT